MYVCICIDYIYITKYPNTFTHTFPNTHMRRYIMRSRSDAKMRGVAALARALRWSDRVHRCS